MSSINLFEKYLSGVASESEVQQLIFGINNNPKISSWIEDEVERSRSTIAPADSERILRNIHSRIKTESKPNKFRFLSTFMKVASIVLLPIISIALTYHFVTSSMVIDETPIEMFVEKGQKATITLADGSKVWLNSNSKLLYTNAFNGKHRNVILEGEAYFEVARDEEKPFVVSTNDMDVKVLGTAFNVKAYPDDNSTITTLIEGSVEAVTSNGRILLKPNERAVFYKKEQLTTRIEASDAASYINWRENILYFENERLEEIAQSLERMYNVHIIFKDDKLKSYRFTGTLPNNGLNSLMEIISITSPIKYKITNNTIEVDVNKKTKQFFQ